MFFQFHDPITLAPSTSDPKRSGLESMINVPFIHVCSTLSRPSNQSNLTSTGFRLPLRPLSSPGAVPHVAISLTLAGRSRCVFPPGVEVSRCRARGRDLGRPTVQKEDAKTNQTDQNQTKTKTKQTNPERDLEGLSILSFHPKVLDGRTCLRKKVKGVVGSKGFVEPSN